MELCSSGGATYLRIQHFSKLLSADLFILKKKNNTLLSEKCKFFELCGAGRDDRQRDLLHA
jgi:hypothetical protein